MSNTISVVIATLGSESLHTTLARLNAGSVIPNEILICMPATEVNRFPKILPRNARLISTPTRGQVAQRAYGLSLASNEYVVQMDDDVLISFGMLEKLVQMCQLAGPRSAVAPLLRSCETGQYLTTYSRNFREIVRSLLATIVCGAPWGNKRMGRIDPSGIPYAIDYAWCDEKDLVETEWLIGGCVVCRREDLVLDYYYPFEGKAYSEDVIHSILWRQRGIRLWVAPKLEAHTSITANKPTWAELHAEYQARLYVVMMNGGSMLRCRLYFALSIFRHYLASFVFLR
jgi:glycosyltransferase involved in cell wall biosynthesis